MSTHHVPDVTRAPWPATALLAVVAMLLLWPSTGHAQEPLDSILDGSTWGSSHELILDDLKGQLRIEFETQAINIVDARKLDELRRDFDKRHKKVEDSYRVLDKGNKSGLEVSIVFDEYAKGNGESVLIVRDKIAMRYMFFVNDQLYKVAVAYNPSYLDAVDFESFLAGVVSKYGDPSETFVDDFDEITDAIWDDGTTRLYVKNRMQHYNAFLMTFTFGNLEDSVSAVHKDVKAAYEKGMASSTNVDSLTDDSGDLSGNSGAVDDILGESVAIDLESTLSEEERKALHEDKVTQEQLEDIKKGGKKKKRRRRKKKKKIKGKAKKVVLIY